MSYVESLVKQKLNPRVVDAAPAANRVTVRLDDKALWKLVTLSTRFGMSKSATAEDLLESAISDAFKVYFDSVADDEKAEVLHELSDAEAQLAYEAEAEALELVDEETIRRLTALYREKHPGKRVEI